MWRATRYTTPCIYNLINALYKKIIADKNLNINLDIPISELSEYKHYIYLEALPKKVYQP